MEKNIKLLVLDVDGTMTDAGVYIMEDGKQFKKFNARDGIGIRMAMKAGIEVGIISHSLVSQMVDARANMLGMKYYYTGQRSKLEVLNEWIHELEISLDQVAFIGDDVNDLEIMNHVGHTACPADAVPPIKEIANHVLSLRGGEGCVREYIDKFLI
ncbi:MAG: HAD-IIIA family hydrolase [Cyclobacteriaceae bacterium]|nr:HAD-IIIA family hydrolase [Cyclobacteriaceae bacterium HetDA_MAG_MS6]